MGLKINDVFWTVQGEGYNAGTRALFVRMPKCNLKCSWCDTEYNSFKEWGEEEFIKIAGEENSRFAVITGGEPTMNKQTPLVISILKNLGFYIAIESNGTFPIPYGIDWVTISPKRDAKYEINENAFIRASEFKYVVDGNGFDFRLLDKHDKSMKALYLSPEWNGFKENVELIMKYIRGNPQWKISLQTHKILNIK